MQIDELKKTKLNENALKWEFSRKVLRPKILLERDLFIASKVHFTFPILIKPSFLQQALSDC